MNNTYCLLRQPNYEDYNRECFVNGDSYHSISLPPVTCPQCKIASGTTRILGCRCPKSLYRELKALPRMPNWSVAWSDFVRFKERGERILRRKGHAIQLQAGNMFEPLVWDVPSRPRQDFFFPIKYIVSRRVKVLFEEHGVRGAEFHPVRCRRIGMLEPWEAFPSEGLSDPIYLYKRVPLLADPREAGEFYEIEFLNRAPTIILENYETCSLCGARTDYHGLPKCALDIEPSAYNHDIDVFRWNKSMIVSKKVADLVTSYGLRGVDICPITEWDKTDDTDISG